MPGGALPYPSENGEGGGGGFCPTLSYLKGGLCPMFEEGGRGCVRGGFCQLGFLPVPRLWGTGISDAIFYCLSKMCKH